MRNRGRLGFSLLEITISMSVMMLIMGGVVQAILGTRKAQGAAVTANMLKAGSQRAAKNIYAELVQSRRLLASNMGVGGTDLGTQYYNLFDIPAAPAPLATAQRIFPRISPKGAFGEVGTSDGELNPASVGNALAFVMPGPLMVLDDANVFVKDGGPGHRISNTPYNLPTYKFVLYHLVQVPLPTGTQPIDGKSYTTQLMRWESKPYLEKGDVQSLITKFDYQGLNLGAMNATSTLMNSLSTRPPGVAGVWDASAGSAATAFWQYPQLVVTILPPSINPNGWVQITPAPAIAMAKQTWAVATNLSGYATSMMSFNTVGNPNFVIPSLTVPAYANGPATPPYGFETAIAGPVGARTVLYRLAMAARLTAGNNMFGQAQQEVVKAFDM